jgi:hypothetical protein
MRALGLAQSVTAEELREADWVLPSLEHVSLNEVEVFFKGQ